MTFHKNLETVSIKTNEINFKRNFPQNSQEILDCIDSISKDAKVEVDPLIETPEDKVLEPSSNNDEVNWQLKRINVRHLPLPKDFRRFEVKGVPSHVYTLLTLVLTLTIQISKENLLEFQNIKTSQMIVVSVQVKVLYATVTVMGLLVRVLLPHQELVTTYILLSIQLRLLMLREFLP